MRAQRYVKKNCRCARAIEIGAPATAGEVYIVGSDERVIWFYCYVKKRSFRGAFEFQVDGKYGDYTAWE